ncbi:MAG TPA: MarP family serine protease, partial [Actinopolymorphaceae bacterium]
LATVDRVMPREAERALLAFSQVVDPGVFPQFLEPFAPERIAPARPPDSAVLADPDVERAAESVVKVNGLAMRCGRSLSGSGFVYARGRVMTNAHVVAGVRSPQVETRDGETYDADVVLYDPRRDVAVLRVPDLPEEPLPLDDSAEPNDNGVVLGYPGNGELQAAAARIRSEQRLRGPDIYGEQQVVREVLSLYAEVRPGNSGGPLVSPSGTVTGLIFAASVEDSATGYALTVDEIAADARQGADSRTPVDTGACA